MPTWTSNVTNVPDIQRKKQSFDDALNSINQFAGIMHQFQQAKQAEQIRNLTATGEVIGKLPKSLQPEATKNMLVPMLEKMMPGSTKSFNWDKVIDFPKYVEGMKQFQNDPVGLQRYIASGINLFTSDEIKELQNVAKAMAESDKQSKLAENVATLQGQPTTTVSPFQTALPQGTPGVRPQFAGEGERTTMPTPQKQMDAFNAVILTEEGRKTIPLLTPKERTGGKWFVNADTGERKAFYPSDKMVGNWYELGGQTKPEKPPTEIKLDNYIETALAGHYPDFINDPKVRKEAYSKFATDKKFKSQIIGEAGQMARDRAPISNVYLQTTEGLLAGKTKGAPRLVPIETPSGESISKPLPNAAQDKLSALKEIRDTLDSVRDQYKKTPGVVGPVSGAYGETLGRILPTPEGYENLRSEINKLFDVVYAKSGKQINQYEAKIIQNYLLKMYNKPETFQTNLRNLYRHLDSLEKSVTEQYGEQGYKTSTKQIGTAEGFLKKKGLIK